MSFDKKKDWGDFYFDQFLDLGDGKEMHIRHEGNSVWFGAYPQSLKDDGVKINTKPDENGVYRGEGESYIKIKATPYDNDDIYDYPMIEFDNGEVVCDKEYFFRIEPIEWEIVRRDGNRLTLISKRILDATRFDGLTNDYLKSEIKAWLNGEFFLKAFDYYEKQSFERGKDKVRLLTLAELENESLFATEFDRIKRPTDYAKAKGCEICYARKASEYSGGGSWWLQDVAERNLYEQARITGLPTIEYHPTGNRNKDVELLFENNDIERLMTGGIDKPVQYAEGGVVPVIEIALPENFD